MEVNFRFEIAGEKLAIAVVQDYKTKEVLMVAFMNKEALEKTLKTKKMHYYSTSRKKLWVKGESSGNYQVVKEVYVDCDSDALLFRVEQKGGACHEGYYSCFFRKLENNKLSIVGKKVFEPEEVYRHGV
ncbi:MAG: phosphoribosyl-AMP cyclohydrolase [Candidatus Hydrothermarchaeota archaeon]|nr:MAG: phosphoribosyl-AMP cyclohydrolase [Candidatus Hydrothermarchaeota archaeon]